MDTLITIGILIIGLLAIGAMVTLLVAIVRLIIRSGIFYTGVSDQEITYNFLKAFFIQDGIKREGEVSTRTAIWRAVVSFMIMLGMGLIVFLYVVPQMGINS